MMKLSGIAAFLATADAGSISAASRRLGLATSVVSERLADLEKSLGTKLIQRTTRKLSLTEAGMSFFPRAQRRPNSLRAAGRWQVRFACRLR